MHIIQITSAEKGADPAILLTAEGTAPLGWCAIDGPSPHHLLVPDAAHAIRTLLRHGVTATEITPPLPVTKSGILWWKAWRDALPLAMYVEFRSLHHESVRSGGSLVRIQTDQTPAVEPWRVLAEAGVDIRCEFNCSLPTGREVHVLVPDPDAATLALHRAGVATQDESDDRSYCRSRHRGWSRSPVSGDWPMPNWRSVSSPSPPSKRF
jgi:hypothetical protein